MILDADLPATGGSENNFGRLHKESPELAAVLLTLQCLSDVATDALAIMGKPTTAGFMP